MRRAALIAAAMVFSLPAIADDQDAQGHFYGAEGLGGNFVPDATVTGGGASTKLTFKPAFATTFALGYDLGDSFRTELEAGIRRTPISHVGGIGNTGSASSYSLMENLLYDFDRGLPVVPHIGGGLGAASTRIGFAPIPSGALQVNGHETAFAYQAIAGVSYAVLPQIKLGLDYRFVSEPDVAFKSASYSLNSNDLLLTMRYEFAAPSSQSAMADAPQVAQAEAPTPAAPPSPAPRPAPTPSVAPVGTPLAPPTQSPAEAVVNAIASPMPQLLQPPAAEQPANGRFAIHLGSYKKTGSVLAGWHEYQAKFPELLNEMEARVSTADLGAKGTFYRVKAGPFPTAETAKATCRAIVAKGYDCDVMDFGGVPIEQFSQTAALR